MAISRRRPSPGLVYHSDGGSQHASMEFGGRLEEAGLLPSMGSVAIPYDDALAESFIAAPKTELSYRRSCPTREDARTAVFEFIECRYDPKRRHSSLGYLSPNGHERSRIEDAAAARRRPVHDTGATSLPESGHGAAVPVGHEVAPAGE